MTVCKDPWLEGVALKADAFKHATYISGMTYSSGIVTLSKGHGLFGSVLQVLARIHASRVGEPDAPVAAMAEATKACC